MGEELFEGVGEDFLSDTPAQEETVEPGFDPLTGELVGSESDPAENNTEPGTESGLADELNFIKENKPAEVQGTDEGETGKTLDDNRTPETKESPSSPLTSLTSALHEDGVLSSLSEEQLADITSGKDLMDVIREQIETNEYQDLNEDQKQYLDALRDGVPDAQFRQAKSTADQYSRINADTLDGDDAAELRKTLIVRGFLSKGFDQADAEKYAGRSIDLGEDVEDAKKELISLKAKEASAVTDLAEKAKADAQANIAKQQKRVNDLRVRINGSNEIIKDVKFNQQTKDQVFDVMTKTAGYDKNNNPMNVIVKSMVEDPEYLVKLGYMHHVTKGFTDWSKVKSGATSSAVNNLEKSLAVQDATHKSGAQGHEAAPTDGAAAAAGLLDALDGIL